MKRLPYLLLIGGLLGVLFSFAVTIEKMHLIQDAAYVPPCNISPFVSCSSVMKTPQAAVFGFPNSLLGIAGFSAVAAVGAAMLAGAKFKRWFWLSMQAGMTFAFLFVLWFFFQSVYRIGALCLYCIGIWTVTIPMFWYVTLHNMKEGNISSMRGAHRYHALILSFAYLVLISGITIKFWAYWSTLV